jgi:hypothetical protein
MIDKRKTRKNPLIASVSNWTYHSSINPNSFNDQISTSCLEVSQDEERLSEIPLEHIARSFDLNTHQTPRRDIRIVSLRTIDNKPASSAVKSVQTFARVEVK